MAVGDVRIGIGCKLQLLFLDLVLQDLQVDAAQGIWTETAGLEAFVGGDVGVGLQQV